MRTDFIIVQNIIFVLKHDKGKQIIKHIKHITIYMYIHQVN